MKILIDALYINNSGGKVLLDYLIKELGIDNKNVFFLLDDRYTVEFPYNYSNDNVQFLKASFWNRLKFYIKNRNRFGKIFCFGNIPPPIKTNSKVYTYFHNVLLLKRTENYPALGKLIKGLKGIYIKSVSSFTDYFIVQTSFVKNLLEEEKLCTSDKCLVLPFYNIEQVDLFAIENDKVNNSFLYISNGNIHKNHLNLLKAWELLYSQGINLELNLTITDNYKELIDLINKLRDAGLNIINHGFVDTKALYTRCEYLIYPSYTESFGLGLIEALHFGCKILAPDLPYVNSVVQPTSYFDPSDPVSISEKVKLIIENTSNKESKLLVKNEMKSLTNLLFE